MNPIAAPDNTLPGQAPTRQWRDLPSPPGWPLLGQLPGFDALHAHLVFERWARELGTPYRALLGPGYRVMVFDDPELAQQLSRERPHGFSRGGRIQPVAAEMGFNGLFSVEGEAWQPQRRLIMQSLNATHFKGWFGTLSGITQRLHTRWQHAARAGQVLEMGDELKRYTVDVTSALAFGRDPNTIDDATGDRVQQHLALLFPAFMKRVMTPFSYWKWLRLPQDRRVDRALAAVHAHARTCIAEARAQLATADPAAPRHALEAMLLQQQALGLTDADVVANVITLLLAGEDTTAHSLAWTMLYLAADRPLQRHWHERARTVLGGAPVCADHAAVHALGGFEHLAFEALRLRPVVPFNGYETLRDTTVAGIAVPARTKLFFINRPSMTDPARWPEPLRYDPGRWEREGAHDSRAFLQFGAGPRVCPGRHLATVEMRLVLSMLLAGFEVELACDPAKIDEVNAFTMMPSLMPVLLRPRSHPR
jgi:cytochrome P450